MKLVMEEGKGETVPLFSIHLNSQPIQVIPSDEIRCLSKQEAARVATCRHHPTQYTADRNRQLFGAVSAL